MRVFSNLVQNFVIAISLGLLDSYFLCKKLVNKKDSVELNANYTEIKTNPINKKSTKEDNKLTLVETIEELGFIPSLDNSDKNNVA